MVYELIGPSLTRMALQKAGEIAPDTAAQAHQSAVFSAARSCEPGASLAPLFFPPHS